MKYDISQKLIILSLLACMNISAFDEKKSNTDATIPPTITRIYKKDLLGYTQKEIDRANDSLTNVLNPKKKELEQIIKDLTLKKETVTYKNGPKIEFKKEYDTAVQALEKAHAELKKVNQNIENYKIITGEKSSNLTKFVKYVGIAGVFLGSLIATDYFLNNEKIMSKLRYEYHVIKARGFKSYLSTQIEEIFGSYKIYQPDELTYFDRNLEEWRPVKGNEEVAKKSFIPTPDLGYPVWDENRKTYIDRRGFFVIFDKKIGQFRQATPEELVLQLKFY